MSVPLPVIVYPEALPVSQRRDDIMRAIRDNQVVIVAGATPLYPFIASAAVAIWLVPQRDENSLTI